MADDSPPAKPDPPPPAARFIAGRGCLFMIGFFVSGFVGVVLAFFAGQGNGPGWLAPVGFFLPPVLFFVGWAVFVLPGVMRRMREITRNAPSPESVAAVAGGEGVEVGTKPEPDKSVEHDDTPTVPTVETTPGKVLSHRLPRIGIPPGCQFGCAVLVACFWNAIVRVFVYPL